MGKHALVNVPVASLMVEPSAQCELADETIYGMTVEVIEADANGWARVRTHYAYEGYARLEHLITDDASVELWTGLPKMTVMNAQADILSEPNVRGWCMTSLPRGALVSVQAAADEGGWLQVGLCDGQAGYTKIGFLGEYITAWSADDEPKLRKRLVDTALSYMGVQYRWGGKTPQGIDCSGLCSMAYMLNGILIYRDADIRDGFSMRKISVDDIKEGDLIFFKGHVAMHIGDGRFVHSTARNGSDGVVLNSLNPAHTDYREDLIPLIRFAGTIFNR